MLDATPSPHNETNDAVWNEWESRKGERCGEEKHA